MQFLLRGTNDLASEHSAEVRQVVLIPGLRFGLSNTNNLTKQSVCTQKEFIYKAEFVQAYLHGQRLSVQVQNIPHLTATRCGVQGLLPVFLEGQSNFLFSPRFLEAVSSVCTSQFQAWLKESAVSCQTDTDNRFNPTSPWKQAEPLSPSY